jgi:hypothetical protein
MIARDSEKNTHQQIMPLYIIELIIIKDIKKIKGDMIS